MISYRFRRRWHVVIASRHAAFLEITHWLSCHPRIRRDMSVLKKLTKEEQNR